MSKNLFSRIMGTNYEVSMFFGPKRIFKRLRLTNSEIEFEMKKSVDYKILFETRGVERMNLLRERYKVLTNEMLYITTNEYFVFLSVDGSNNFNNVTFDIIREHTSNIDIKLVVMDLQKETAFEALPRFINKGYCFNSDKGRLGFIAKTLNGLELFGNVNFELHRFKCIKCLLDLGISENTILAYMFNYLNEQDFYKSYYGISYSNYMEFLTPLLQDLNYKFAIAYPISNSFPPNFNLSNHSNTINILNVHHANTNRPDIIIIPHTSEIFNPSNLPYRLNIHSLNNSNYYVCTTYPNKNLNDTILI